MKSAIRICQLLFLVGVLLILGKPVPTVSAQGGSDHACVQSLSEVTELACNSCCSNALSVGYVSWVTGISNSSRGFESSELQQVDCGAELPGGCSLGCGVGDYPKKIQDGTCCIPDNYGPCSQDMQCCGGICDSISHYCASCISNGGYCNPNSGGCCTGMCDPYTATCTSACVPDYGYCDGLYFNNCCSGICDLTQMSCVNCIPSGSFAYGSGLCCGGESWWNYTCW